MRRFLLLSTLILATACTPATDLSVTKTEPIPLPAPTLEPEVAQRFGQLALDCVQKEFPNKISRTTNDAESIGAPSEIFPVFYGCFDWHSAVHGHWLLVRLLRLNALTPEQAADARAKLEANFAVENVAGELANFRRPERGSWERPYGWAWFLQLAAELREWSAEGDTQAAEWLERLEPLEADIVAATKDWLPKLAYPIHLGTHNQSSFAFTLMRDWAVVAGDAEFIAQIDAKARQFHGGQTDCPLAYEPSGEDFLSACLMTADLMRRVLPQYEFEQYLKAFLPNIPTDGSADWLAPAIVLDASDGKLVHLDGVNSSRAWNLYHIARALPETDPRRASLLAAAEAHRDAGVAAVSDEHYSGSHWLASFATYLMTDRGWSK